jgi:putative FmdB family regulatory protein
MPVYTYLCRKCSEKFDILVGMTQEKNELKCPNCNNKDLEKAFVPFRIASSGRQSSSSSKCNSCSGGNCSSCSS